MYDLCGVFMATWVGVYDEIDFNDTLFVQMNTFVFIHMARFMIPRPSTRTEVVTSYPIRQKIYRIKCREYNSYYRDIGFCR